LFKSREIDGFVYIFINLSVETLQAIHDDLITIAPIHHPEEFNLQTQRPQLYLQLHFVPNSPEIGIYPSVTHKPCFFLHDFSVKNH